MVGLRLLCPLAVMLLAAGLHVALGGDIATAPASGHLLMTVVNLPLVLLLGGPLGEEFGWRGLCTACSARSAGMAGRQPGLGLVWGVWHLPLFFIDGTAQAHIPPGLFLLSVVAMSVVFAWLVNRTAGSVVAALLFHTAINFWPSVVPVLPTEAVTGPTPSSSPCWRCWRFVPTSTPATLRPAVNSW
jgi:membrane protease YdiL (CAAX protease family)